MKAKLTQTLTTKWLPRAMKIADTAALEIATDIHRRASMLAPKDTSALVASGRVESRAKGGYTVTFGGGRVPYARLRHYVNKKNPQSLGYLERAGDSVSRGSISKYIRG